MHWKTTCCVICNNGLSKRKNLSIHTMAPIVEVEQGALQGSVCTYADEEKIQFSAFKGIPYAKPPIGELRFKEPQPPDPWKDIRDATVHGPICPQYNDRQNCIEPGSEDCLYLNLYTKHLKPSKPLPVMVWIHGGGFYTGSGNSDFYGPEFFMKHDVVLVTFNYRLEVLGFLCLDNEEVPGNAGMKDQVAALRWVKRNIAAFGGDPNNITIFGCSAGAASTGFHLVSKMSAGLFNKAICQSGSCLHDYGYNLYPVKRAFELGKLLGKDTTDKNELLEFLRSVPASSLVNIKLPFMDVQNVDLVDSMVFCPVIEKVGSDTENFLSEMPPDLVRRGEIANVPLLVGYTSGDGIETARTLSKTHPYFISTGAVVPRELKLKWTPDKIQAADDKIRKRYFKKELTADMYKELVDLENDRMFAYNTYRLARYHNINSDKPVYLYKFKLDTERNITKKKYGMDFLEGVCHSDDLPYLFNITVLDVPLTEQTKQMIKQIVSLWVNFATTGNPTPNEPQGWKPYTENEKLCCNIGKTIEYVTHEDSENMKFWDELYEEMY